MTGRAQPLNKHAFAALQVCSTMDYFYVSVNLHVHKRLSLTVVFRYVPEDLPEVVLPNLASKKRAMRKRVNTFPGEG